MKKICNAVILSLLTLTILLTGCFDAAIVTAVDKIPNAGNSIATESGRVFVTCTGSVFEKRKNNKPGSDFEYDNVTILHESGEFLGIAGYKGIIYTALMKNIFKSYLLSYNLTTGEKNVVYRFIMKVQAA